MSQDDVSDLFIRAVRVISRAQALRTSARDARQQLHVLETDAGNVRAFLAGHLHSPIPPTVNLAHLAEHVSALEQQLTAIEKKP